MLLFWQDILPKHPIFWYIQGFSVNLETSLCWLRSYSSLPFTAQLPSALPVNGALMCPNQNALNMVIGAGGRGQWCTEREIGPKERMKARWREKEMFFFWRHRDDLQASKQAHFLVPLSTWSTCIVCVCEVVPWIDIVPRMIVMDVELIVECLQLENSQACNYVDSLRHSHLYRE